MERKIEMMTDKVRQMAEKEKKKAPKGTSKLALSLN